MPVTAYDIHFQNPTRPPDWRWLRAVGIADEQAQRPTSRRDGEENILWIRKAALFKQEYDAAREPLQQMTIIEKYPEILWAYNYYANPANLTSRYIVEARILAQQTNREIAYAEGATEGTIAAYEQLFFSVRDRLFNADYIYHKVMGGSLQTSLSSADYGILWKLYGYVGGPFVLDAISRRIANPSWVSRPDEVIAFFHDVTVGTMKSKAAIAAATIPVNSETRIPILESFVRYVEVERSTEGGGQAENQILGNLTEMLTLLPFVVGTKQGAIASRGAAQFDTSAVELRGSDLIALASGGEIENQEELLGLKFPNAQ